MVSYSGISNIIDIEKSTGEITVTEVEGDDVVRMVDNGGFKTLLPMVKTDRFIKTFLFKRVIRELQLRTFLKTPVKRIHVIKLQRDGRVKGGSEQKPSVRIEVNNEGKAKKGGDRIRTFTNG